jgi:hypothetical protein
MRAAVEDAVVVVVGVEEEEEEDVEAEGAVALSGRRVVEVPSGQVVEAPSGHRVVVASGLPAVVVKSPGRRVVAGAIECRNDHRVVGHARAADACRRARAETGHRPVEGVEAVSRNFLRAIVRVVRVAERIDPRNCLRVLEEDPAASSLNGRRNFPRDPVVASAAAIVPVANPRKGRAAATSAISSGSRVAAWRVAQLAARLPIVHRNSPRNAPALVIGPALETARANSPQNDLASATAPVLETVPDNFLQNVPVLAIVLVSANGLASEVSAPPIRSNGRVGVTGRKTAVTGGSNK